MKKVGFCFIMLIIALVAAFFIPWERVELKFREIINKPQEYSSLKIYSLAGNLKVYIDGEEKGVAKRSESYFEVIPINTGEHEVSLIREAEESRFYTEFRKVINFEKGFDTVISWENGPTDDASSGWILYARKSKDISDVAYLNVQCFPVDCHIHVNDSETLAMPISEKELSLAQQYTLKAQKEGYQDLEFQILPEDNGAREKLAGFDLFLEVHLYKIPL